MSNAEMRLHDCQKLGLVNYNIRVRKIKIGTLIKRNGYFAYLTGKTGKQLILRNATNLCLDSKWGTYIKKIEKYKDTGVLDNTLDTDTNIKLYNELLDKFTTGIYGKRPNPIGDKMLSAKNTFTSFTLDNQCNLIYQILQLSKILGFETDLSLLHTNKKSDKPTREGGMQISKKVSNTTSMYLINQSPTGLFEKQIDLLTV